MKKVLSIVLAVMLFVGLTSCNNDGYQPQYEKKYISSIDDVQGFWVMEQDGIITIVRFVDDRFAITISPDDFNSDDADVFRRFVYDQTAIDFSPNSIVVGNIAFTGTFEIDSNDIILYPDIDDIESEVKWESVKVVGGDLLQITDEDRYYPTFRKISEQEAEEIVMN